MKIILEILELLYYFKKYINLNKYKFHEAIINVQDKIFFKVIIFLKY